MIETSIEASEAIKFSPSNYSITVQLGASSIDYPADLLFSEGHQ